MALTLYQQQLNDDFNYYFAYINNPLYYTCKSSSALTSSDFYYNYKLYINSQISSYVGDLVASSKIYPNISGGYGIYNPATLLRGYVSDPWFQPDEITWTFPQTIRNIRVDVTEGLPGITNTQASEVFTYVPYQTELEVGRTYKVWNDATPSTYNWYNITDANTGEGLPLIMNQYSYFTVAEGSETIPYWWGSIDLYQSNYIAPSTFNKAFIISGYDMLTPNTNRTDGTNPEDYVLTDSTSKMFSKQEGFKNKLNINERASIRLIQGKMHYDEEVYSRIENIRITVTKPSGTQYRYKYITDNTEADWWKEQYKYSDANTQLQSLTGMMVDLPVGPWNLLNNGLNNTGVYSNKYFQTGYNTGAGWVSTLVLKTAENIVEVGDTYTVEAYVDGYQETYISSQEGGTINLVVGDLYKVDETYGTGYDLTGVFDTITNAYLPSTLSEGDEFIVGSTSNPVTITDMILSRYSIEEFGNEGITSKAYEFEVVCNPKFTPYELAWENELGGFDYFSFRMISENSETSEKTYFENKVDALGGNTYLYNEDESMGRTSYDKGVRTLGVTSNEVVSINSDWLNDAELLFLRDLFKSKNVYMLDETVMSENLNYGSTPKLSLGRWYSVILDTDSISYKTNAKGLRQLNINLIKNTTKK